MSSELFLVDTYAVAIPEFDTMVLDDGKVRDFNLSSALSRLDRKPHVLAKIRIEHSGTRINGRVYPGKDVQAAIGTWTHPYRRPLLQGHPKRGGLLTGDAEEPKVLGRIDWAEYIQTADSLERDWVNPPSRALGSGYTVGHFSISDKDAIDRVIGERLLTVSVGKTAGKMQCSICLADWAESMRKTKEPGCDHRPGNVYEVDDEHFQGEMPFYFVARKFVNDHVAEVFRPAQPYATVLNYEIVEDSDLRNFFAGNVIASSQAMFDLCDEQGHTVRLLSSGQDVVVRVDRITDVEAYVLASMEDKGVLDFGSGFADGYDSSDLRAAINRIRSSGQFRKMRDKYADGVGVGKCLPVADEEAQAASLRFLERYSGPDKSTVGLMILASNSNKQESVKLNVDREEDMSIEDMILEKLENLPEDKPCTDAVLRELFDEEVFAKLSFDNIEEQDLVAFDQEEREAELDLAASLSDAVLTTKARKKLPDSAFCGPNRSYPAHDASHVRNGLARLAQFGGRYSPAVRARIKACLLRRAKRFGIKTSKDAETQEETMKDDKVQQLEKQLSDTKAQVSLLEAEITALKEQRDSLSSRLRENLARTVFDLRSRLGKADVKALDSEDARKEYLGKLLERTTESLEDSIRDLQVEIDAAPSEVVEETTPPAQGPSEQTGAITDSNEQESDEPAPSQLSNRERIRKLFGK